MFFRALIISNMEFPRNSATQKSSHSRFEAYTNSRFGLTLFFLYLRSIKLNQIRFTRQIKVPLLLSSCSKLFLKVLLTWTTLQLWRIGTKSRMVWILTWAVLRIEVEASLSRGKRTLLILLSHTWDLTHVRKRSRLCAKYLLW